MKTYTVVREKRNINQRLVWVQAVEMRDTSWPLLRPPVTVGLYKTAPIAREAIDQHVRFGWPFHDMVTQKSAARQEEMYGALTAGGSAGVPKITAS